MASIARRLLFMVGAVLALLGCQGPPGEPGPKGDKGDIGAQGPMPVISTNSGLVGTGETTSPLAVDFDTNGTSTKVARADHTHSPALYSGSSTTTLIEPTSTIWADITTVAIFTDRFSNDISRSNSTFTFTRGGTYLISFSLNTYASNQYVGYRLRRITGTQTTLLQRTNSSSTDVQTPGGLTGLFQVAAGDAVSLQYVIKGGTNNGWSSSNPLDGESMVTSQLDILQVN
jgi:hypothetical protein